MNFRKSEVRSAYDIWGKRYDEQDNPTRDLSKFVLQRIVPVLEGKIVVEAGCGTGTNTAWLAERCVSLIGLDFSSRMLDLARQKVNRTNVEFKQHDIVNPWPVANESVDLVLINLVLEHIEQIDVVLRHAAAIMRPDAQLIITEYHPDRVVAGKGAEIVDGPDDSIKISNHWHPLSMYEAIALDAGLQFCATHEWNRSMLPGEPKDDSERPLLVSVTYMK